MKQLFSLNSNLQQEQRRHSELLRLVTVSLIIITPLFTAAAGVSSFSTNILVAAGFSYACTLLAFVFNRLGLVRLAGWLVIGGIQGGAAIFLATSSEPTLEIQTTGPILVLPVIISGVIIGAFAPFIVGLTSAILLCIIMIARVNVSPEVMISALSVPVFLVFLSGLFSSFFERSIARLVNQLTERNRELEEINARIEAKRKTELEIGDRINLLAAQVSAAFAEQTRGAAEQLTAVVEVTSALEELNQTNEQISQAAGQVAGTAHETLSVAERGGDTISNSTDAMRLLQTKVSGMAASMDNLSNQAHEIDQIIELITEVAEETNLLALNATIEAAGAREYGRRFAAVASEVQRLANRSRDAADAVRSVVNEVQEAIKESAQANREGLRDALQLTNNAREIGEAIGGIVSMVQNTATLAQQISLSIQQQKSAGTQVLDTMRQISNISNQVVHNSHELMVAIYELNEEADRLKSNNPFSNNGPASSGTPNQPNETAPANLLELNPAHYPLS